MQEVSLHFITSFRDGGAQRALSKLAVGLPLHQFWIFPIRRRGKYNEVYSKMENVKVLTVRMLLAIFIRRVLCAKQSRLVLVGWMYHGCLVAALFSLFSIRCGLVFNIRQTVHSLNDFKLMTVCVIYAVRFLNNRLRPRLVFVGVRSKDSHEGIGFNTGNSVVIFNGVALANGEPKLSFNSATVEYVTASRYSAQKGIEFMLKGFADLVKLDKGVRLSLYGEGLSEQNVKLKRLIDDLGVSDWVSLLGPGGSLDEIYLRKHFYLQTSLMEGFSNSVCEAMSYGLIPICSNVGDNQLILDQTGFLFSRCDAEEFHEALLMSVRLFRKQREQFLAASNSCRVSVGERFTNAEMIRAWANELKSAGAT